GERLAGGALHVVFVEEAASQLFAAKEHVLHDVEVVRERQILVDRLDPKPRRIPWGPDMNRGPLPEELPVVDLVDACDAFGQDRLTGAVISAEGGDLSGIEVQVHLGQSLNRAEMLVDAPGLEPWLAHRRLFDHLGHHVTLSGERGVGAAADGGGASTI